MSDYQEISNRLSHVKLDLAMATSELDLDKVRNMTHLAQEIEQICQRALTLPPEEGKKLAPQIAEMVEGLDKFEARLRTYQDEMKAKLK